MHKGLIKLNTFIPTLIIAGDHHSVTVECFIFVLQQFSRFFSPTSERRGSSHRGDAVGTRSGCDRRKSPGTLGQPSTHIPAFLLVLLCLICLLCFASSFVCFLLMTRREDTPLSPAVSSDFLHEGPRPICPSIALLRPEVDPELPSYPKPLLP